MHIRRSRASVAGHAPGPADIPPGRCRRYPLNPLASRWRRPVSPRRPPSLQLCCCFSKGRQPAWRPGCLPSSFPCFSESAPAPGTRYSTPPAPAADPTGTAGHGAGRGGAARRSLSPTRRHLPRIYQGAGHEWAAESACRSKRLKGSLAADSDGATGLGWAGGAARLVMTNVFGR